MMLPFFCGRTETLRFLLEDAITSSAGRLREYEAVWICCSVCKLKVGGGEWFRDFAGVVHVDGKVDRALGGEGSFRVHGVFDS